MIGATQKCSRIIRTRNWILALDLGDLLLHPGIVEARRRAQGLQQEKGLIVSLILMRRDLDKFLMNLQQRGLWDIQI